MINRAQEITMQPTSFEQPIRHKALLAATYRERGNPDE